MLHPFHGYMSLIVNYGELSKPMMSLHKEEVAIELTFAAVSAKDGPIVCAAFPSQLVQLG
jgi:hypothetical protein